jgi:hypothetical protein
MNLPLLERLFSESVSSSSILSVDAFHNFDTSSTVSDGGGIVETTALLNRRPLENGKIVHGKHELILLCGSFPLFTGRSQRFPTIIYRDTEITVTTEIMISRLPVELFIVIRDHLFQLLELRPPFDIDENVEDFNEDDSRRSWRNFLSVSRKRTWLLLRNQTMVWSLNRDESRKYVSDGNFRRDLMQRMKLPHKQLQLLLYGNSLGTEFQSNWNDPFFPPIREACTIKLVHCDITYLTDLKTVQSLTVDCCTKLHSVECFETLSCLSVHNNECDLLSMFPLEKLEKISIKHSFSLDFSGKLYRFRSLRYLYLIWNKFFDDTLDLPSLECLQFLEILVVKGYKSFDLSGLVNLKSLEYSRPAVPKTILGKEQIFPKLRRLSCLHDPYYNNKFNFSNLKLLDFDILGSLTNWNAINNIQHLTLRNSNNMIVGNFTVGENVKILKLSILNIKSIEFLNPKGIYHLELCHKSFTEDQLALFGHLQSLTISCLRNIKDISAVKHVPILSIASCHYIENFSCLGSQRYLTVYYCYSLTDKDVENYGAVQHLSINFCEQLTEGREYIHSNIYRKIKFDPRTGKAQQKLRDKSLGSFKPK